MRLTLGGVEVPIWLLCYSCASLTRIKRDGRNVTKTTTIEPEKIGSEDESR